MNRYYIAELPIAGTSPHVEFIYTARTKRDAAKKASQLFDAYYNKNALPGHRQQVTPASHWNINGPFFY